VPPPIISPQPALERVAAELATGPAWTALVADVEGGGLERNRAADTVGAAVVDLAEARAELALAQQGPRLRRSADLLGRWLDASLRDTLAVQSWLADGDKSYLAEHREAARAAAQAERAFRREYARARRGA
jgi:hypothetical protein